MLKRWVTAKDYNVSELVIKLFEYIWIKRDPGKMLEIYWAFGFRYSYRQSDHHNKHEEIEVKMRKNVSTVSGEYS